MLSACYSVSSLSRSRISPFPYSVAGAIKILTGFSPVSCHSDVILSVACFFDVILHLLILLFDVMHPYSLSPSWFFRFRNPSPAPLFSLFLESATWFLAVIIHSDVILIFLCDVLLTFSDVIHSDVIIRRVILLIRFILLIRITVESLNRKLIL